VNSSDTAKKEVIELNDDMHEPPEIMRKCDLEKGLEYEFLNVVRNIGLA
jgi:hypothetical protein